MRADGGVASCCYSFFKKDDFGELRQAQFDDVWNNATFRESRRLIRQWDRSGGREMDDSALICHGCLKSGVRPSYIETPTQTQGDQVRVDAATGKRVIPVAEVAR